MKLIVPSMFLLLAVASTGFAPMAAAEIEIHRQQSVRYASGGVTLDSRAEIHPTLSNKRPSQRLFAGDGCHRLVLILRSCNTTLAPKMYRIRIFRSVTRRDATSGLLSGLDLSANEYFSFLSLAHSDREFTDAAALRAHVERVEPDRLDELERVIAADAVGLAP
jgi:hypothetical protein